MWGEGEIRQKTSHGWVSEGLQKVQLASAVMPCGYCSVPELQTHRIKPRRYKVNPAASTFYRTFFCMLVVFVDGNLPWQLAKF